MQVLPVMLTKEEIDRLIAVSEPEIIFSAHMNNLPYIPLIPSLRAYALLDYGWPHFMQEYKRAVVVAIHSGQSFAYID